MDKYQAIEEAMYLLSQAGYTINDTVYQALVKERALIECAVCKATCTCHMEIDY